MSNYRDDMNDTLVLADATVSKQRSRAEDTLRMNDAMRHAVIQGVDGGSVALAEELQDRALSASTERASFGDEVSQRVKRRQQVVETLRLRDRVRHTNKERAADALVLGDEVQHGGFAAPVGDGLRLGDEFVGRRRVRQFVEDGFALLDWAQRRVTERLEEAAAFGEAVQGRARARTLVFDALALGEMVQVDGLTGARVVEVMRFADEVKGRLVARGRVSDTVALFDEVQQSGDFGQAWTANTDGWAMSRYAPMTFTSLVAIDGVLYGSNAQGVFALDGVDEVIDAQVRTGALDVSGGNLAIPHAAYLEYELVGAATFAVTTTQSGMATTYNYPLKGRPVAEALTNARAEFGRGLLGRHFAYTLQLTGKRAYINDWVVLVAPSKRRI